MYWPLKKFGTIYDVPSSLTWDGAALESEAAWRTTALARHGVGPGQTVILLQDGTARFFANLFAVWSLGATAACLDPELTAPELETLVAFLHPAAILVDEETALPDLSLPVMNFTTRNRPSISQDGEHGSAAEGSLDDPALVLFTSGTTGDPKGVVLSFRALLARLSLNVAIIGREKLSRTLLTLPVHFGHGLIGNALTPLWAGGDLVLHGKGMNLAATLGETIDRHRISFLSSVPAFWRLALKLSAAPQGNSLARVHVGSAPLSSGLWDKMVSWSGAEVVNCYGMTETANWFAGASSAQTAIKDGLVGRPWGGVAGIRGPDGEIHDQGEGEIVVQTPCVMTGYLDRPELTRQAISSGWYRTGDYGRVDADGSIILTGRIKDEINNAGFKIQPGEIDVMLERHPSVAQACVFAVPDPVSGESVGAAVCLRSGTLESAEDLQTWCRERLRRAFVPTRWFIVDEIPLTSRGKVARDRVRRKLLNEDP